MSPRTRKTPETIPIRIEVKTYDVIYRLASAEERTLTEMITLLVHEALAARQLGKTLVSIRKKDANGEK